MSGFGIYNAYRTTPPPPPPPPAILRVWGKNPGEPAQVFEAAGPIAEACEQVRQAGFKRAFVQVR